MSEPSTRWLGCLAFVLWAIHASWHIQHHQPENLLWCCHVGAMAISLGLFVRSPALNATGVMLQMLGLFMWAIDLASGGELIPTSPLTHFGVMGCGILGARRIGMPRHSWLYGAAVLLTLHVISRFVTPVDENINLAFAVHPSLSKVVHSHDLYIATITVVLSAFMWQLERALRWTGVPYPPRTSGPSSGAQVEAPA